jgi:zinc and cadmium transporter
MPTFLWIVFSGILMSAIALVGSVTLFFSEATLRKILLPLVALAAGTLLGGALLHMIPAAIEKSGNRASVYIWVLLGFTFFLALERFLHWHHCHRVPTDDAYGGGAANRATETISLRWSSGWKRA